MPFINQGKTNLTYILIVVVLAVVAGGWILGYQYLWAPKEETKMPEVKPPAEVPVDEIADWKTYRNEEYGFEVKYPAHAVIKEYPPTEGKPYFTVCFQATDEPGDRCVEPRITVDVEDVGAKDGILQYAEAVYLEKKDIVVDGQSALSFSSKTELAPTDYVVLEKGNKVFTIASDVQVLEGKIDFNQILSTFRFIEEEIAIPKVGFISGQSDTIMQFPNLGNTTSITIDFAKCSRGGDGVVFGLGSTHFAFEGIKNDDCIFYYGTEIENPNWDGSLPHKCNVPTNLSKKSYTVSDFGIQMEALKPYCIDL